MMDARTRFPRSQGPFAVLVGRGISRGLVLATSLALLACQFACQSENDMSPNAAANGSPSASFAEDRTAGAPGVEVQFTDTSRGEISDYVWDFGAAGTRTERNPRVRFDDPGAYTVVLTVSGPGGESTLTKTALIEVDEPASAGLDCQPRRGFVPLTALCTDSSTGATALDWNFGDAAASTERNPAHTFSTAGQYTVSQTAQSAGGFETDTLTIDVFPLSIGTSPATGTAPVTVTLTANVGGLPGILIWTVDGQLIGSSRIEEYTFRQPGTYRIGFVFGETGTGMVGMTEIDYVVGYGPATADFEPTPAEGSGPMTVSFEDRSTGAITRRHWNFGDGSQCIYPAPAIPGSVPACNAASPTHVYAEIGSYDVALSVTGPAALPGGPAVVSTRTRLDAVRVLILDASFEAQTPNGPIAGAWRQLRPANELVPATHLSLSRTTGVGEAGMPSDGNKWAVLDGLGTNGATAVQNVENGITQEFLRPVTNTVLEFDYALLFAEPPASSVMDAVTATLSDGATTVEIPSARSDVSSAYAGVSTRYPTRDGSAMRVTQTFTASIDVAAAFPGSTPDSRFRLTIRIGNTVNEFRSPRAYVDHIRFVAPAGPQTAQFVVGADPIVAGEDVVFGDESCLDPGVRGCEVPTSWRWDFGTSRLPTPPASSGSRDQHPTYRFPAPGVYDVTLRVARADRDLGGDPVGHGRRGPVAAFETLETAPFTAPATLHFQDRSSFDPGDPIVAWSWDFGGWGVSSSQDPAPGPDRASRGLADPAAGHDGLGPVECRGDGADGRVAGQGCCESFIELGVRPNTPPCSSLSPTRSRLLTPTRSGADRLPRPAGALLGRWRSASHLLARAGRVVGFAVSVLAGLSAAGRAAADPDHAPAIPGNRTAVAAPNLRVGVAYDYDHVDDTSTTFVGPSSTATLELEDIDSHAVAGELVGTVPLIAFTGLRTTVRGGFHGCPTQPRRPRARVSSEITSYGALAELFARDPRSGPSRSARASTAWKGDGGLTANQLTGSVDLRRSSSPISARAPSMVQPLRVPAPADGGRWAALRRGRRRLSRGGRRPLVRLRPMWPSCFRGAGSGSRRSSSRRTIRPGAWGSIGASRLAIGPASLEVFAGGLGGHVRVQGVAASGRPPPRLRRARRAHDPPLLGPRPSSTRCAATTDQSGGSQERPECAGKAKSPTPCGAGLPGLTRYSRKEMKQSESRRGSRLAPLLAQPARFPLLRELLQLARELVEGVVEGEDDLGRARDVVAVQQPAVAVQVGEDRLGDLERALLGLDQRRLQRVDVVAAPEALVADDRDLAVDAVDRIEVVLDADLFEDVRVAGVEAALLLDLAELAAARAVEGVAVVQEEHALGVVLAVRVLAVSNAALHAGHPCRMPPCFRDREGFGVPGSSNLHSPDPVTVSGRLSNHNPVPTRHTVHRTRARPCQREQATCQSQRRTLSLSLSARRPPLPACSAACAAGSVRSRCLRRANEPDGQDDRSCRLRRADPPKLGRRLPPPSGVRNCARRARRIAADGEDGFPIGGMLGDRRVVAGSRSGEPNRGVIMTACATGIRRRPGSMKPFELFCSARAPALSTRPSASGAASAWSRVSLRLEPVGLPGARQPPPGESRPASAATSRYAKAKKSVRFPSRKGSPIPSPRLPRWMFSGCWARPPTRSMIQ